VSILDALLFLDPHADAYADSLFDPLRRLISLEIPEVVPCAALLFKLSGHLHADKLRIFWEERNFWRPHFASGYLAAMAHYVAGAQIVPDEIAEKLWQTIGSEIAFFGVDELASGMTVLTQLLGRNEFELV
jgi:hypothetical protein